MAHCTATCSTGLLVILICLIEFLSSKYKIGHMIEFVMVFSSEMRAMAMRPQGVDRKFLSSRTFYSNKAFNLSTMQRSL